MQSAQTNGDRNFNKKLTKSYSELYHPYSETKFQSEDGTESKDKHEPLLRTQSEEPPKYLEPIF